MSDPTKVDHDPAHLYPEFRAKFLTALSMLEDWCEIHAPGVEPVMGDGFRSTERQKFLYAQGRTTKGSRVTNCDGVTHRSNHQSSLAGDVWLKLKGKKDYDWDGTPKLWDYWGHCLRSQGLKAGTDWKRPDDPHGEWPQEDTATYRKAREWQKSQGLG